MLFIFWIFPINKKKVLFSSFDGRKISCNPKYIYEYLKENKYDLKYIWEYNGKKGKNYVSHNSLRFIFAVMTSKYIIINDGISPVFPLRKRQVVVNTWHGSGAYKRVGKFVDEKINGTSIKRQRLCNKQISFYLSGCQIFSTVMAESLEYPIEKFIPTGMPRNSILFKQNDVCAIKNKYGFDKDVKICLYAPTFRGETSFSGEEDFSKIDFNSILKSLEKRFGGNWVIALRCHYSRNTTCCKQFIDLTSVEDMQELLIISDVLISDYSSCIWDYSFTYKPCFLFCYDLSRYKDERNFYIPIHEWGFPVSTNLDELKLSIENFDADDYVTKMNNHHTKLGSYESEFATKKAVDYIFKQ